MAHNGRDAKLNPRVFFDISIGGQKMGRIVTVLPDEMGVESPRELKRGDRLYVYKRTGAPCRRCAEPIETANADGRNVWWCPVCQPETMDLVER